MTDNDNRPWFDLDLAVMEDEAVVVLAKECEYAPARDELIVRYAAQTSRLIRWLAHSSGMSRVDIEDASQNAVFWTIEAISKYDTLQIGKPRGCSFRSFIHRVTIARFKDYAKHLRRIECRYDRSAFSPEDSPSGSDEKRPTDPAALAEAHESMHRLQSSLKTLDSGSEQLWQLLTEGYSLRESAVHLGISYDAAKRRRRKLLNELKLRLNGGGDSSSLPGMETIRS